MAAKKTTYHPRAMCPFSHQPAGGYFGPKKSDPKIPKRPFLAFLVILTALSYTTFCQKKTKIKNKILAAKNAQKPNPQAGPARVQAREKEGT